MQSLVKKFILFLVFLNLVHYVLNFRILGIFCLNSKSHFASLQPVMKSLANQGHQVEVYSHFSTKAGILNYKDHVFKKKEYSALNNLTYNLIPKPFISRVKWNIGFANQNCGLMNDTKFQQLFENPPKYDLIIMEVKILIN